MSLLVGASSVTASATNAAERGPNAPKRCGFHQVYDHDVTYRESLSCDEAKAVLRQLKGAHAFVPMACGRNRNLQGWKLQNLVREPTALQTRYTKGDRVIHYRRFQNPQNETCPPQQPVEYDEYET